MIKKILAQNEEVTIFVLNTEAKLLQTIQHLQQAADKQIKKMFEKNSPEKYLLDKLMRQPGIGVVTASVIGTETPDFFACLKRRDGGFSAVIRIGFADGEQRMGATHNPVVGASRPVPTGANILLSVGIIEKLCKLLPDLIIGKQGIYPEK